MSAAPRVSALAPFRVRSYRYQWPADLATSWAFEMETLILGWYVLVETGSVLMLTVFASLQHVGTLIAPMFGVMGDRVGHRNVLCAMRATYMTLALTLMVLAFTGALNPVLVLLISGAMGLVRPSDVGMRAALIGETMPSAHLIQAVGIQRTTMDSARIAGALTGAGLVALLGMGPAYLGVAALYGISVVLTLRAGATPSRARSERTSAPASPWRDLRDGLTYVWRTPLLRATMTLAFMLNLTCFPLTNSLMPYVAKSIYQADQTWLGYMVATIAAGALLGSLVMSRFGGRIWPARATVVFCLAWFTALIVFAQIGHPVTGLMVLVFVGCAQSMSQVPMATMILRNVDEQMRGRVMGIRMLAIYGNIPGLLLAGPLIGTLGYPLTATLFCLFGITVTLVIALHWRGYFWHLDAPGNRR